MNRHQITILAAVVPLAGLAACGSDDHLTTEEFQARADAICADASSTIGETLGPVFGGDPSPEQLQEALDTIVATSRTTRDDIAALDAPSDLSDDVDALLAAFDAGTDEAESLGLAFFDTDDDPWAAAGEQAGALGLDACAGG
ncbi:hypothetical protein [Ilumatobacter nonamiensis]|uniref:hypothetical protein n=1 Tax=Ilumatobacter nonamiensis TaxID=467093 RepID=UPI00058CDC8E|nr:hypothetical protein [Ilumatobacter nonamiensis]